MARRHFVIASCGHWWHESGPDGMKLTTPRVCTHDHASTDGIAGSSPQRFGMVHVVYVAHDGVTQPAYEHWPADTQRWDVNIGRANPASHLVVDAEVADA